MSSIIGRNREKRILQNIIESKEAELLAIYGRRRIGKTFLIKEYFEDKGMFFELTGTLGGDKEEQLWNFSQSLAEGFQCKIRIPPKNWNEAFTLLLEKIDQIDESCKVVLFFDELPWLATLRSDLIRSLEYFWNRHLSRKKNIIMILCGSAASWMINKIIHNRGGLYGRLTQKIHLQAFTLLEAEHYLQAKGIQLDRKQFIELYMVTGGIAKYLNHIEKGLSSAQNIQNLCFSRNGFLFDEFHSLFTSLFDNSERHLAIIKALAKSHKGLTLKSLIKFSSGSLGGQFTKALADLQACGFVQFIPFYGREKRDGLYRLVDEYTLFYLRWMDGNEKLINFQRSPSFFSWAGHAFENICIKHHRQMIEALKLSVVAKSIAYWEKTSDELPGAQIDLVIDRTDRCINLIEMKFSENEYIMKKDYANQLNQRRSIFSSLVAPRKTIFNVLMTPFGAAKNQAYLSSIDQELTLDALFAF